MLQMQPMKRPLLAGAAMLILILCAGTALAVPDIKVTKLVSGTTFAVGDTLTYTIRIQNLSSNQNAGTFTVFDTLPAGLTYLSSTSSVFGSSYSGSTHTWTITGPYNAQRLDSLQIVATVNAGAEGKVVVNTASKTTISGDPTGNDVSSVSIQVASQPPTISAVLPSTGARYQSMTVKLAGSHFIQGVTQVNFGAGISVTSRTVTSPDTMVAGITIFSAAALGPRDVHVINPAPGGGEDSLLNGFSVENPLPVLTTLFPAIVHAGDVDFTLTVNGSHFVPGSVVMVNGANRTATFVDSTKLQATVLASDVAAPGYVLIKAFNPTPGGGASSKTDSLAVRPSADLAVQKSLGPLRKDTVTYVLKVKNLGPNDATNVALSDVLPATLTYISSAPSGSGQYSNASHIWTIGSVAAGDSATCTIVTRLTNPNQAGVTITNIAGGLTATEFDRVSSNNADSVSIVLKVVRPGDTNNDFLVDARDIIEIGLCYGITGPARTGTADTLQQYLPTGWNTAGSPEVCAYADCNGNGTVDSGDVWTIVSNWGRTQWTGEIEPSAPPSAISRGEIIRQLLASAKALPPGKPRDEIVAMLQSHLQDQSGLPTAWQLDQNYPNPFNGGTTIRYSVPQHEDIVRLRIYDVLGRTVKTFERADVGQGTYAISWDGNADGGMQVSSGVYFYRIETAGFTAVRRLLYIR